MSFPKTRLSTRMSGSARETEQRLRNLFARHKRPALVLAAAVMLCIGLCGGLVACKMLPVNDEIRLEELYDPTGTSLGEDVQQELLTCIDGENGTLVAGHYYDDYPRYTLVIGVEGENAQLLGPVYSTGSSGGMPHISTFQKDGVDYLLYTVNGGHQGSTYGEAGLIAFDGADFTWVWPVEGDLRQQDSQAWADYQAYWEDKLALLCPGGVELFQQSEHFVPMSPGDKQWYFSQRIRFTQEEPAVPDEIMDRLRNILEDATRDQNNPWRANNTSAQWQIAQVTPGEDTLCGQRYTLLAASSWSEWDWLGMEVLLRPVTSDNGTYYMSYILRIVTGSREEVEDFLAEENRQTETLSLTTASGRKLIVELEMEPLYQEPNYLAVEQIRVYENGTLLQTLEPKAVWSIESFYLNEGMFMIRNGSVGGLDVRDLNFDGSSDLGILAVYPLPHNLPYAWFLWNEAESSFVFSTCLFSNPTLDEENQQVVEHIRGAVGRREEAVYVWNEDGTLEQIDYRQLSW